MRSLSSLRLGFPAHRLAALLAAVALVLGSGVKAGDGDARPPDTACSTPARDAFDGSRPAVTAMRPVFDARDQAAALEAVQVALTEVGDGSTYVWYRHGGRLSGLVQPTRSFHDALGRVCRQLVVTLNDASRSSRTESIACRLADGDWQLDG